MRPRTKQQLFDKVCKHLSKQQHPCFDPIGFDGEDDGSDTGYYPNPTCVYFGDGNERCAIEALLPEDIADTVCSIGNSAPVASLLCFVPHIEPYLGLKDGSLEDCQDPVDVRNKYNEHLDFLESLQTAHDGSKDVRELLTQLTTIARTYNLKTPYLDLVTVWERGVTNDKNV